MLFQQTLFIVAAFLTTVVHSLPSSPPDMGLKVIRQYEAEGGNITWYGDQTPAKRSFDTVDLNRRDCSSGNLTCSDKQIYTANQWDCDGLQSFLAGQPSNGIIIRDVFNSVCYVAGGQIPSQCCISATIPISNVTTDADYLNFVVTLNNQCRGAKSGKVAGIINSTKTKYDCNNVCLSNHPNDCTQWK
ncbi:hypothetical protein V8E54_011154 [Elaphomyces granulatus]